MQACRETMELSETDTASSLPRVPCAAPHSLLAGRDRTPEGSGGGATKFILCIFFILQLAESCDKDNNVFVNSGT